MEYTIVTTSSFEDLMKQVNKQIKKGWIPQGGVSVVEKGGICLYSQAMIKN